MTWWQSIRTKSRSFFFLVSFYHCCSSFPIRLEQIRDPIRRKQKIVAWIRRKKKTLNFLSFWGLGLNWNIDLYFFFCPSASLFFFSFLALPLTWNDWLNNPSLYVNKFSRMKFPLFIVPHHGQPKNDCNHRSRSSLSLSLCLTRENKQIFLKFFLIFAPPPPPPFLVYNDFFLPGTCRKWSVLTRANAVITISSHPTTLKKGHPNSSSFRRHTQLLKK